MFQLILYISIINHIPVVTQVRPSASAHPLHTIQAPAMSSIELSSSI